MFQIEADAFGWTRDLVAGVQTDLIAVSSAVLEYELSDSSDVQVASTPYARARTRDAAGAITTSEGAGDVTMLFKQRLTGLPMICTLPCCRL
jgi:hypothetical protein